MASVGPVTAFLPNAPTLLAAAPAFPGPTPAFLAAASPFPHPRRPYLCPVKSSFKNALRAAAVASVPLLAACSSPNKPISENGPASPASAAEMALMDQHDSLMAQTSQLYELKAKLSGYHSEAPAPYIHGLLAADKAMMSWMHQYKAPDTTAAPATRLAYFQQQKQILDAVQRQYKATIDSATRFHAAHPAAGDVPTPSASK
jgi:hypothetical protein